MRAIAGWLAARPAGLWWLVLAAVSLLVALGRPATVREVALRDLLFVVDITGSMNVRDYERAGSPVSRLDIAKAEIARVLRGLPCGSRAGLAIFTERRSFPLFAPAEVCENFAPMADATASLDWRMGWDGDSRVASGVQSAIRLAASLKADLVFLTDGHEAPPLPYQGRRPIRGEAGIGGVIVGVGGARPSPIPKYDEDGREIGFYGVGDMVHSSRVGMAPPTAASSEGFHPRNNPYGEADLKGTEHLSAVRTDYLRQMAAEAGLGYAPLDRGPALDRAIADASRTRLAATRVPLDAVFTALALVALVAAHFAASGWLRLPRPRPASAGAHPPSAQPRPDASPDRRLTAARP
jgi:mxaL protein